MLSEMYELFCIETISQSNVRPQKLSIYNADYLDYLIFVKYATKCVVMKFR